jgi:hypothetical protein
VKDGGEFCICGSTPVLIRKSFYSFGCPYIGLRHCTLSNINQIVIPRSFEFHLLFEKSMWRIPEIQHSGIQALWIAIVHHCRLSRISDVRICTSIANSYRVISNVREKTLNLRRLAPSKPKWKRAKSWVLCTMEVTSVAGHVTL